jgi:hypothetical protein
MVPSLVSEHLQGRSLEFAAGGIAAALLDGRGSARRLCSSVVRAVASRRAAPAAVETLQRHSSSRTGSHRP